MFGLLNMWKQLRIQSCLKADIEFATWDSYVRDNALLLLDASRK